MNQHFLCSEKTHFMHSQRKKKNQYLKFWNKDGCIGHLLSSSAKKKCHYMSIVIGVRPCEPWRLTHKVVHGVPNDTQHREIPIKWCTNAPGEVQTDIHTDIYTRLIKWIHQLLNTQSKKVMVLSWFYLYEAYSLFTNYMQRFSANIFASRCRSHTEFSPLVLELIKIVMFSLKSIFPP